MQQLNLDGKTKEELAVEFIQKHEPPEGYFLGFSGGKDSVVLKDLTIKSGVKFQAYYSAVGIDPPELVKFIKKHHPDVIFKRPKSSLYATIPTKGFPTKFARWCCDWLKKNPTKDVPLVHRLMGLRAEESVKRAKRGNISKLGKWIIYKPVFDWLTWEIWDHIERHELPYCSLYDEGFDRIGCVVCPFLCRPNQWALNQHRERWPKHYYAFEKAMKKLWDGREKRRRQQRKGYANTFEEFLDNWYKGNPSVTEEDCGWFD